MHNGLPQPQGQTSGPALRVHSAGFPGIPGAVPEAHLLCKTERRQAEVGEEDTDLFHLSPLAQGHPHSETFNVSGGLGLRTRQQGQNGTCSGNNRGTDVCLPEKRAFEGSDRDAGPPASTGDLVQLAFR